MNDSESTPEQTNTEPTSTPTTTPVASTEPVVSSASEQSTGESAAVTPDTTPALSIPSEPTNMPPAKTGKKLAKGPLPMVVVVLIAVVLSAFGGYIFGNSKGKSSQQSVDKKVSDALLAAANKELAIPQGATEIAKCAKNRGTQYALPKDIPLGPVYNVYEGKVIGIEFMVGKDDLLGVGGTSKSFLNLPLYTAKYDHVNIGLLSQGHAGFPQPHYHVDIMIVPTSVTDKITCS